MLELHADSRLPLDAFVAERVGRHDAGAFVTLRAGVATLGA